jgi:hypothetical protein
MDTAPIPHDLEPVKAAAALVSVRQMEAHKAQSALVAIWDCIDAGKLPEGSDDACRLAVGFANDALAEAKADFVRVWKAAGSPLSFLNVIR